MLGNRVFDKQWVWLILLYFLIFFPTSLLSLPSLAYASLRITPSRSSHFPWSVVCILCFASLSSCNFFHMPSLMYSLIPPLLPMMPLLLLLLLLLLFLHSLLHPHPSPQRRRMSVGRLQVKELRHRAAIVFKAAMASAGDASWKMRGGMKRRNEERAQEKVEEACVKRRKRNGKNYYERQFFPLSTHISPFLSAISFFLLLLFLF